MSLAERLARWLYPSVFVRLADSQMDAAAQKGLANIYREDLAHARKQIEVLTEALAAKPAPEAPVEPRPEPLPPEYESVIALRWGGSPLAAAATRSAVRTLVAGGATREQLRRAALGSEEVF